MLYNIDSLIMLKYNLISIAIHAQRLSLLHYQLFLYDIYT